MNLRKLPIPPGFSKSKLKMAFAIFFIILSIVVFWALHNNPADDAKKNAAQ